jgi:hypothetical protein
VPAVAVGAVGLEELVGGELVDVDFHWEGGFTTKGRTLRPAGQGHEEKKYLPTDNTHGKYWGRDGETKGKALRGGASGGNGELVSRDGIVGVTIRGRLRRTGCDFARITRMSSFF